ncbi:hypothetical protein GOODEAATRI_002813 [Goodea atripinnis]|uniref:Uncharacterized protein n=1 Tax=Goodea atripinnis TaxID=208336 RepID=A0ABV0MY69_9TELE
MQKIQIKINGSEGNSGSTTASYNEESNQCLTHLLHPAQVASLSQGNTETRRTNNHVRTHLYRRTIQRNQTTWVNRTVVYLYCGSTQRESMQPHGEHPKHHAGRAQAGIQT